MLKHVKRQTSADDGTTWEYFDEGSFNEVYINESRTKVYKIPKSSDDPSDFAPYETVMDQPERAVRLWNEINPGFAAEVYKRGWIAPFIKGVTPTECDIIKLTLEIYEKTGRVVIDALNFDNFVKDKNGNVHCIDIGAALKLESVINEDKSQSSLDFWNEMKNVYNKFFDSYKNTISKLTQILKSLLVLQSERPDIRNVALLENDMGVVQKLTLFYDGKVGFPRGQFLEIFPINLLFVKRIPIFHPLITELNLADDELKVLYLNYLNGSFDITKKIILVHLMRVMKISFSQSIRIILKDNLMVSIIQYLIDRKCFSHECLQLLQMIEARKLLSQDLFRVISILNIETKSEDYNKKLAQNFLAVFYVLGRCNLYSKDRLFKVLENLSFAKSVIRLAKNNKLTPQSFAILSVMNESRIINEHTLDLLLHKGSLKMLEKSIINKKLLFSTQTIKTQQDFDEVMLALMSSLPGCKSTDCDEVTGHTIQPGKNASIDSSLISTQAGIFQNISENKISSGSKLTEGRRKRQKIL